MIDLYDVGDGRHEQRRVTLEKCRGRVDTLKKQKLDIDATIDELDRFIAMVEAAERRSRRRRIIRRRPMPSYTAPVRETRYIFDHLLGLERYSNLPGFENATPDMVEAILTEGAPLRRGGAAAAQPGRRRAWLHPQRGRLGDHAAGLQGRPTTSSARAAGRRCRRPRNLAGRGLPSVLAVALTEYLVSANQAFEMYHGLTQGAIASILAKGSDEQKAKYLPKMVSGEWGGTMNLTEPHCGTDLGLLRTKAEPQDDGSYKITGTKIFISSGEHDLTDNIIHLVLAKIAGAPDNVKGISLFIVPKFLVNDDGSLGARNGVSCGSIEEKMGIHGNSTCLLNYDGATGYLVGEPEKGLAGDVHHDERGAARRRPAGPRPGRGRPPERRRTMRRTGARAAR